MNWSRQQAGSARVVQMPGDGAVERGSVMLFFALLPAFVASLALRAHILAAPAHQSVIAAASASRPAALAAIVNPTPRF
jgi:hypothetical protein